MSVAEDDVDRYRPQATAEAMPIGLQRADVADLPGAGRLVFAPNAPGAGVELDLFRDGLRRLLHTFVAGMHAGYGLAALADAKTFLLAARRLADALYGDSPTVIDSSESNAAFRSAVNALYPDATWTEDPRPPVVARGERVRIGDSPASLAPAPIFVVGCPRSGTTWLQAMLLSHAGAAGPKQETALFSAVKDVLANPALAARIGADGVTKAVRSFATEMFAASLASSPPGTRLVEKTPHHALHLDIVERLFPDAFVVAIHRDARDVVRSLLEVEFGPKDAGRAARGWVESVTAVERFVPSTLRMRRVRYETLRQNPVDGISDLLEWAGLTVDSEVAASLRERSAARVSHHNRRAVSLDRSALHAVYRYAGEQLVHLDYMDASELHAIRRSARYRADVTRSDAVRAAKQYAGKLRRLRQK